MMNRLNRRRLFELGLAGAGASLLTDAALAGVVSPLPSRATIFPIKSPLKTYGGWSQDSRCVGPIASFVNHTYQRVLTAEAPFTEMRVLIGNGDTANAMLVNAMSVSATGATADSIPSNGGVLTSLTINGAAFPYTVAAAVATERPTHVWTDWVGVSSVGRTDGGSLPVAMVRLDSPVGALSLSANVMNAFWNSGNALLGGRFDTHTRDAAGKCLSGTWSGVAFISQSPILAVEFRYGVNSFTIANFGDSKGEASALTNQFFGHAAQAAQALSTPARPVGLYNFGRAGETISQFSQRALDYLAMKDANGLFVNHPDALIMAIGSPNDGGNFTLAVRNYSRRYVYDVWDACRARGIRFMPTAIPPNTNGANTVCGNADDTIRQAHNLEFMSIVQPDYIPIDIATPIQNPASPQFYRSTADTIDGIHESDSAATTQATVATIPAVRKLLIN